jgi:hypothetical protein
VPGAARTSNSQYRRRTPHFTLHDILRNHSVFHRSEFPRVRDFFRLAALAPKNGRAMNATWPIISRTTIVVSRQGDFSRRSVNSAMTRIAPRVNLKLYAQSVDSTIPWEKEVRDFYGDGSLSGEAWAQLQEW